MPNLRKYTLYAIPILLIGFLLFYFSDIVGYIIMAWVISMIGAPLHNFLSSSKYINKTAAAGLTLFVFALFLLILVRILAPPLIDQAKNLAGLDYEKIIGGLEEPISDMQNWLQEKGLMASEIQEQNVDVSPDSDKLQTTVVRLDSLLKTQWDTLSDTGIDLVINVNPPTEVDLGEREEKTDYLTGVKNNIFDFFNPAKIPKLLGSFVGFFGNILITILSVFFIAFFFLKEKGLFSKMVSFLVPNNQEGKANHAIEESSKLLIRYFVGLVAQALVITLITTILLKLFGFKNALLMAFCFAVFNLIPYIGPILGNLFGVLIVISSNLDVSFYDVMLPKIIKTIIIFGVLQLADNFFVQPNIFSRSVKAHPLEIFIVVLMGAKIGGVAGMVLAIPAYTVLRVLAKVFLSEFEVVKKLTAGM